MATTQAQLWNPEMQVGPGLQQLVEGALSCLSTNTVPKLVYLANLTQVVRSNAWLLQRGHAAEAAEKSDVKAFVETKCMTCTLNCYIYSGTEEVGLAAMEGWQWTPDTQQGVQWNLGGGQAGEAGPHPGSLEGVDSLPEAMAKSRKSASRRVSRSNSKQFERLTSQVRPETHSCKLAHAAHIVHRYSAWWQCSQQCMLSVMTCCHLYNNTCQPSSAGPCTSLM